MPTTRAYGITSTSAHFLPLTIELREPRDRDIVIDILYCGVCHSDISTVRGEFSPPPSPLVPGHEIVGVVREIGSGVTRFKVGDRVGVGCMCESCLECDLCLAGHEQLCEGGIGCVWTYGKRGRDGAVTTGGYARSVVVHDHFVVRIPDNLDPAGAAPLLCGGATVFSPLRRALDRPGYRVGIIGLGGLGHLAVKFAVAMGATVTVFSHSPAKKPAAVALGASDFVPLDAEQVTARAKTFDFIFNTSTGPMDLLGPVGMLKALGTWYQISLPHDPLPLKVNTLCRLERRIEGCQIAGMATTQDMLDFAGAHGITSEIEILTGPDLGAQLDEAYRRIVDADVRFRFVVDSGAIS